MIYRLCCSTMTFLVLLFVTSSYGQIGESSPTTKPGFFPGGKESVGQQINDEEEGKTVKRDDAGNLIPSNDMSKLPVIAQQLVAKSNLFFIQNADSAVLEKDPDFGGRYILRLNKVPANVIYFSQSPSRKFGQLPNAGFVNAWNSGVFGTQTPNAALVSRSFQPLGGQLGVETHIIELAYPSYDQGSDTFTYTIIDNDEISLREGAFKNVTLYIS